MTMLYERLGKTSSLLVWFVNYLLGKEGCFGAGNSRSLVAMHLKINSLSFQWNLSLKVSSFWVSNTTKMTTSEAIVYIKISLIYIIAFSLSRQRRNQLASLLRQLTLEHIRPWFQFILSVCSDKGYVVCFLSSPPSDSRRVRDNKRLSFTWGWQSVMFKMNTADLSPVWHFVKAVVGCLASPLNYWTRLSAKQIKITFRKQHKITSSTEKRRR